MIITLLILKPSALFKENNFILYLYVRKKYWHRKNFRFPVLIFCYRRKFYDGHSILVFISNLVELNYLESRIVAWADFSVTIMLEILLFFWKISFGSFTIFLLFFPAEQKVLSENTLPEANCMNAQQSWSTTL